MPKPAALIVLSLAALMACELPATYRNERVARDLKKMCAKDYGLSIETRRTGDNLQAFFWRVGLLRPGELELQEEAAKALQRVMLCATRISLSTDAPLKFIQVKVVDALTGSSVSLWRFVPDIRDSMYTRFADEEYMNRLVIEFNTVFELKPREWKEPQWDDPMTLPLFLAKQVVLRAKRQSAVGLQAHEEIEDPAKLIVVLDNWATIEKEGSLQEQTVADSIEKAAKAVMTGYDYRGFRELVLKDHRGLAFRRLAL